MTRRPRPFLLLEVLLAGLLAAGTIGLMLSNLQAARLDHRASVERQVVEHALEAAAVRAALDPTGPVRSFDDRVIIAAEPGARDADGCVQTTLRARAREVDAAVVSTVLRRCP